jgi:hypothetical protein
MTLNQRVPGSSPGAPTNKIKDLAHIFKLNWMLKNGACTRLCTHFLKTHESPPKPHAHPMFNLDTSTMSGSKTLKSR